jgi:hypothetical protein
MAKGAKMSNPVPLLTKHEEDKKEALIITFRMLKQMTAQEGVNSD